MSDVEWAKRRDRYYGLPVPPSVTHGKNYARYLYGCDCEICFPPGKRRLSTPGKSGNQRNKEYKARKRGKPVPEGKHGSTGHRYYGCRCDVCVGWFRQKRWEKNNRWRETARGHWHDEVRDGKAITVIHWPPRELTEPWLCPTCREFKVMPA